MESDVHFPRNIRSVGTQSLWEKTKYYHMHVHLSILSYTNGTPQIHMRLLCLYKYNIDIKKNQNNIEWI